MAAPIMNHRRDRHEVRRALAQLVIRGRDLTGSYFPVGFDPLDQQHRLPANDDCIELAVATRPARDRT